MVTDSNEAVVLTAATTEAEAAMIVARLEEEGIEAFAAGQPTTGFPVEVSGLVQVLVRRADLDLAQQVLRQVKGA
jgi:hypothetical protein